MFLLLATACFVIVCCVIDHWYRSHPHIKVCRGLPALPVALQPSFLPITRLFGHLPLLKTFTGRGIHPSSAFLTTIYGCHVVDPVASNGYAVMWLGPLPIIALFRPETAELLLSSNTNISKSIHYSFLTPWLGTGLLTSSKDKWRTRRKLLTPSFHFKILDSFVPIMAESMKQLIAVLDDVVDRKHGLVDDLSKLMLLCALDVICETAMGIKINAQSDPDSNYVRDIHLYGMLATERFLNPLHYLDFIFALSSKGRTSRKVLKRLHAFTDQVIKQRKEEILLQQKCEKVDEDNNSIDPSHHNDSSLSHAKKPFMDTLIEEHLKNPSTMTLLDIREEVDTFMFEGHDTTAWGATWSLHLIGLHPHVEKKIFDELDDIFDGDCERPITMDDLKRMKYIECVIKESQRLYPSVPFFARTLEQEMPLFVKSLGTHVTVPAGMDVVVFPAVVHRTPQHWPNACRFIPERFEAENCIGRHPYAFIPFSAGPRNCIGQKFAILEEKAIIASVFRHFSVRSVETTDQVNVLPCLILKSEHPLKIVLSRRRNIMKETK